MKLDKKYSSVWLCPVNGDSVNLKRLDPDGHCPACGNNEPYTLYRGFHLTEIRGKWLRPSVWEWMNGERAVFKSRAALLSIKE